MASKAPKEEEEPLKFCSSGRHVIAIDKIDCCIHCIRRRNKKLKSWKKHRKTKYKERDDACQQ